MDDILLTFGIPMYNAEKYIKELLSCFKKYDDLNYEIIIVDDGSKDNSYNECKRLLSDFPFLNIRLYKQDNHGVSYTRNKIVEYSRGQWITFIDSDDLIDCDLYIKRIMDIYLESLEISINTYSKKNYEKIITLKNPLPYLIEKEIINSPCTKFYKVDFLRKSGVFFNKNMDLGEDLYFNLELYKKACNINYFYSDMYLYRHINSNSLTHKIRNDKLLCLMTLNDACSSLYDNIRVKKSFEYIKVKNMFSCVKDYLKMNLVKKDVKKLIKEMRKSYKRKFLILNDIKTTILYNFIYIVPTDIIVRIVRRVTNEKN